VAIRQDKSDIINWLVKEIEDRKIQIDVRIKKFDKEFNWNIDVFYVFFVLKISRCTFAIERLRSIEYWTRWRPPDIEW